MPPDQLQILRHNFGFGGWIPRALDGKARPLSSDFQNEEERGIARALLAAMEGNGRSNPNPSVGAVFIKEGKVLGEGATLAFGDLHAERLVLSQVPPEAVRGASCYVTLEPCAHQGKQPPCTEALIQAGISRCVIGTRDPHPKVAGQGAAQLRAAGIEVIFSELQRECRTWHFPFLASLELGRPLVIGKWAQTLDGQLADDEGSSQWITGPRSRAYGHWLRQKYDLLLIGVGTALVDAPSLTVRDAALPRHRHPHKGIFDPKGRLRGADERVRDSLVKELKIGGPHLFWMVEESEIESSDLPRWWQEWEEAGFASLVHLRATRERDESAKWDGHLKSLAAAYRQVSGLSLQSLMVEGGSQLLTQLLRADRLDALHVFIRAGILGGSEHRVGRLRGRADLPQEDLNPRRHLMDRDDFKLISTLQLGDDILLECAHRRFSFWN